MTRNRTTRDPKERIKTARGRKISSIQWIERQLADPYVKKAQLAGYRSRAAYKLLELDNKLKILKPHSIIVDLGAAPGSWCQVALEKGVKKIVAIDLLPVDPMPGLDFVQMDFMDESAPQTLLDMLGGQKPALVLSDIAPNTTGHKNTDHIRIMALVEAAAIFACEVLPPGGHFIAKVFQGGAESGILTMLKQRFKTIKHIKPSASRKESSEIYLAALNFKG